MLPLHSQNPWIGQPKPNRKGATMSDIDSLRGDVEIISKAVQLVVLWLTWERGGVVELRALGTLKGIVSGYFDAEHSEARLFRSPP